MRGQRQPPRRAGPRRGRLAQGWPKSSARKIALRAALLSQKRGISADLALEDMFRAGDLDGRDRRLAEELAFGSVRHRASLDLIIAAVSERELSQMDIAVLEAVRQAIYQTFYLSRIPDHAAVDEAVRLARSMVGDSAASFANAVLRAALRLRAGRGHGRISPADRRSTLAFRGGEHVMLARPLLPDPARDELSWLAAHYSYPRWLVERLIAELGREAAERVLAWGNEVPPLTVRVNPLRADREALAGEEPAALCQAGRIFAGCSSVARGGLPGCYRLVPEVSVGELRGLVTGLFTVQDEAQQHAAVWLAPAAGEKVLDLCAAPGGKATALAERAADKAEVLAGDAEGARLALVGESAARLGLKSVLTRELAVPPLPEDLAGRFDKVLADVPCSNSGAMNRRVEARWRARPEEVRALAGRQRGILEAALAAAKPAESARVLYATCSLLAEENGEVVRATLAARPEFRLLREETILPRAGIHDGAYLALLGRA